MSEQGERLWRLNSQAVADKIVEQDALIRGQDAKISLLEARLAQLEAWRAERTQTDFAEQARRMGSGPTSV